MKKANIKPSPDTNIGTQLSGNPDTEKPLSSQVQPEDIQVPTLPPSKMVRRQKILDHLDLSRATLYRLLAEKKFPAPVYLPGGGARWIWTEVEAWAEQRIQEREA